MAEGILRESLDPRLVARSEVVSAGMAAAPGYPASDHAVTACSEIGIDISTHASRAMTRQLAAESDLVLCMELHHLYAVRDLFPEGASRFDLLSRFALGDPEINLGVADPIGGSLQEYRESRDNIQDYIKRALPRIEALIAEGGLES